MGDVEVYRQGRAACCSSFRSCSAPRTPSITRSWCSIRASSAPNNFSDGAARPGTRARSRSTPTIRRSTAPCCLTASLCRRTTIRRSRRASTSGCTGARTTPPNPSSFTASADRAGPGNAPVADQGQIQLDCFGRINGAGWHWAGEADVFESIAAVKKRFKIDDKRVMLRGFSQGGEGAWHIALHYPDRFAAAEIGAGTVSRRAQRPGLAPYQLATLRIWENISEWALNVFNLPLAGHDGDRTQIASLPGRRRAPNRGQLESSLRARAQLEKEGFPSEGEPDYPAL